MDHFRNPVLPLRSAQFGTWWLSLVVTDLLLKGKADASLSGCSFNRVGHHVPGKPQSPNVLPCWPLNLQSMVPPPALLSNIDTAHSLSVLSSVCLQSSLAFLSAITPYAAPLYCLAWLILFPPFPFFSCVCGFDMYAHVCMLACACMRRP